MHLTADTHVHVYPCYDVQQALNVLRNTLHRYDSSALCMAFLTERSDCNFFASLEENAAVRSFPRGELQQLDGAVLLREPAYTDLYIFPGRQVVTEERIEILSLTTDQSIPDGLPAREVLQRIRQANGIPVLSWAPGKWFFKRKKVIRDLLHENSPGSLLIGDTSLRPTCWLQPLLMRRARHLGYTVINGSDPLPFAGEEELMGRYGVRLDCDFDRDNPLESIRSILSRPGLDVLPAGSRGGPLVTLRRLYANSRSKK